MKKISVFLLSCIFLSGCTMSNENLATKADIRINNGNSQIYENNESYANGNSSYEMEKFDGKNQTIDNISDTISGEIESLDEVNEANVVIVGNSAIVGIELVEDMPESELVSLKITVETLVKSMVPEIENVAVTTAPDLMRRIQGFTTDNEENKNTTKEQKDITEELAPIL